jgi:uncharacterized protein
LRLRAVFGVGGPAGCKEAAKRCTERNRPVGPTLKIVALGGILLAAAWVAAQSQTPPVPTRWVTDTVGFMSPAAAAQLDSRLGEYEQQTHHQLIVWIGDSTGNVPIEDWAVRTFAAWKVGRKGIDDGLALFIMAKDRRLRFEVGYGLEGDVPDALAGRIINDTIVPRIRAGDPDGAVTAGMEEVAAAAGAALPGATVNVRRGRGSRPPTLAELIVYGIIGLIVLIIFATHPSLVLFLLANILIGGRRGGGDDWGGGWSSGGGGGGWSGGGGRSGGGGASGSW